MSNSLTVSRTNNYLFQKCEQQQRLFSSIMSATSIITSSGNCSSTVNISHLFSNVSNKDFFTSRSLSQQQSLLLLTAAAFSSTLQQQHYEQQYKIQPKKTTEAFLLNHSSKILPPCHSSTRDTCIPAATVELIPTWKQ